MKKWKVKIEQRVCRDATIEVEADNYDEARGAAYDRVRSEGVPHCADSVTTVEFEPVHIEEIRPVDDWVKQYQSHFTTSEPQEVQPDVMTCCIDELNLISQEDIYEFWLEISKRAGHDGISIQLQCGKVIEEGESYFVIDGGVMQETVLDDQSCPGERGYDAHIDNPQHWTK